MNSADIRHALSTDALTAPRFAGVFPFDKMVEQFSCGDEGVCKLYVFNTHASLQPGEHWIAVMTVGKVVYYFDSFGRHPGIYPRLADKFKLQARNVFYNRHLFQNLSSTACGDYCVLFALLTSRGWTMQRYIDWLFDLGTSESRDHVLRQILIDEYGVGFFSSYRQNRLGLTGKHNLHNVIGLRAVGEQCSYQS